MMPNKSLVVGLISMALSAAALSTSAEAKPSCDLKKGKRLFQVCKACHTITQDQDTNKQGPSLKSFMGQEVGSLESFDYSFAMEDAEFIWDRKKLLDFIENPSAVVPWNGMPFQGIKSASDREDIVCYIEHATKK